MSAYEKLGVFYLGKSFDTSSGRLQSDLILYDSKDLTTHAVIIGMTGSGKTGLALGLLEEALIDNIPVIAIDPKGDLPNLLLTFPNLAAEDFLPWVDAQEAARAGLDAAAVRGAPGRALAQGPGRLGSGAGAHRAPARGGRVRGLHARQPRRAPRERARQLRAARPPRSGRIAISCANACRARPPRCCRSPASRPIPPAASTPWSPTFFTPPGPAARASTSRV